MEDDDLVILFTDSNGMIVQNIQDILGQNSIPSVHISAGHRMPQPVGLRVKFKDYNMAVEIIKDIELKPLRSDSGTSKDFMKAQRIGCIVYIIGAACFMLYQLISDL